MNQETSNAVSELAAPMGADDPLTIASMAALISTLPTGPRWIAGVAKPEHVERMRTEFQHRSPFPPPRETLYGMSLYPKPGQTADFWMFQDDTLLHQYLNDEVNELDLVELKRAGQATP